MMESKLEGIQLLFRGKVRDIYKVDGGILMVATDRISAFDVVMPNPIPDKGKILTAMSCWWFKKTENIIKNHLITDDVDKFPEEVRKYKDILKGRSVYVKEAKPLPVECVVRGYLSGSGWKDYKATGEICGIKLPKGLVESQKLPEPIFTPATKAPRGEHDINITFQEVVNIVGKEMAEKIRDVSLKIYKMAHDIAYEKGIIIADTKFEFGICDGELILIDELLTPDSSRFWPLEDYEPGRPQKSYDKQYLRDYLESIGWDKKPPAPPLPQYVIEKTREKYINALKKITGMEI
jgi:phosphoribosylaminoimidazole-succinocarboxamide synthase